MPGDCTPQKAQSPGATGLSAEQIINIATLTLPENLGKPYATVQAQFALLGHTLQHTRRADDGRITFIVSRWNQARFFSHLHDVRAFLTQIGGAA